MEQQPKDLHDYIDFLKRRKKHLFIPLICIFLLGAAVALKRGEHIAVTFFLQNLSKGFASTLTLVAQISVALILVVMVWGGIKLVLVTSAQISPALRIPMAVPYLALPIGSAVMLFHVITSMIARSGSATEGDQGV